MKRIIIIFLLQVSAFNALGWENKTTHPTITKYASDQFFDPIVLKESFSIESESKRAEDWLQEGAKLEDDGTRPQNHFYSPTITNPTKETLETAGLSDILSGMAAPLWAQSPTTQRTETGGDWSWSKVRDHEYNYLTSLTKTNEDANLARMLKSLGYQMHLIQDMSQPGHVRNNVKEVRS